MQIRKFSPNYHVTFASQSLVYLNYAMGTELSSVHMNSITLELNFVYRRWKWVCNYALFEFLCLHYFFNRLSVIPIVWYLNLCKPGDNSSYQLFMFFIVSLTHVFSLLVFFSIWRLLFSQLTISFKLVTSLFAACLTYFPNIYHILLQANLI